MHVLVHAQATRVIQTGTVKGVPSFHAVEFGNGLTNSGKLIVNCSDILRLHGTSGPFQIVNATKEVILSCGPIGTPHLLQLSGIGDAAKLAAVGIKSTINNPHVGQNITDHACVSFTQFLSLY